MFDEWWDVGTSTPVHQTLARMANEKHVRAREIFKLSDQELAKFCRRVMKGKRRTAFLDEVRQRVIVRKLKGEL